jgi:hypothetical protein
MTATHHASRPTESPSAPRDAPSGRPTGLLVVIGLLSVALIALGAWAVFSGGDDAASLPPDVDQALTEYNDAWNTSDGEAFIAATTSDYVMHTEQYGDWNQQQQAMTVGDRVTHGWHSEWVGEPIVTAEGPGYGAVETHIDSDMMPEDGITGISTFTIVDDGGQLKVARHTFQSEYYE